MTLATAIDAKFHSITVAVTIDSVSVDAPLSITTDAGIDVVAASATLRWATVPAGLDFHQEVRISLGYDGFTQEVFRGYVVEDGRDYFPFTNEVKCKGRLYLAQYQYPTEVTYSSQTDTAIVSDLLSKVGITDTNIEGAGQTFGAVQDVVLKRGQPAWNIINDLDQVTGYYTFDLPAEVRRKEVNGQVPLSGAVWDFVEGENLLSIRRPRSVEKIHNKVVVTGLSVAGSTTVSSTWRSANSNIPNPPQYVTYNFRSDLIESAAYASTVAQRILKEQNRIVDVFEIEVPGNPTVFPGDIVGIQAASVGVSAAFPYHVRHVSHSVDSAQFTTRMTVFGGYLGTADEQVTDEGEETTDISYPEPSDTATAATGGKPYATVVVAASDSTAAGASGADYVCTGTDDHSTIQSAVDACTVGGRVLLLEGTYTVGGNVTLASQIRVEGQGHGTIVKLADSTNGFVRLFDASSTTDAQVANLTMDGNQANQASGATYGVYADSATDTKVINCQAKNMTGQALYFYDCTSPVVSTCVVKDNDFQGIIMYGATGGHVENCDVSNSAVGYAGVQVTTGTASPSDYAVVNCYLHGNWHGVQISDASGCVVSSNRCYNSGDSGVFIDASSNCMVVGNTCHGNNNGIYAANGSNNAITGNNSFSNSGNDIALSSDTGSITSGNIGTVSVT